MVGAGLINTCQKLGKLGTRKKKDPPRKRRAGYRTIPAHLSIHGPGSLPTPAHRPPSAMVVMSYRVSRVYISQKLSCLGEPFHLTCFLSHRHHPPQSSPPSFLPTYIPCSRRHLSHSFTLSHRIHFPHPPCLSRLSLSSRPPPPPTSACTTPNGAPTPSLPRRTLASTSASILVRLPASNRLNSLSSRIA